MDQFANVLPTLVLQAVVGLLLEFNMAYNAGFGGDGELLLIGVGSALGVWGTGAAADMAKGKSPAFAALGTTLAGAFLGVLLILITPPFGFAALLLPLLAALTGYYLARDGGSRR